MNKRRRISRQDTRIWDLEKESHFLNVRASYMNCAPILTAILDREYNQLDIANSLWGPYISSEQYFRYITRKKQG